MDIYLQEKGLLPDPVKLQTALIQSAIDECAASGGGTVYFPDGMFCAGTIYMRSGVFLHLNPGTTLKASSDLNDYNAETAWVQNAGSVREHTSGGHFIVFLEIEHAGILGEGVIDGNGKSFGYSRLHPEFAARCADPDFKRPSQMIYLCESRDIRIRNVRLFNSPYWNCFVHGCENVIISGLWIKNNPDIPNGDGIDIDSSRQVVVSDCIIDTEDDCITFRCNRKRLKNRNAVLEDVTVTNCQLRTPGCNAFRIGVGNGIIRNCVVSNIVIRGSSKGICMEARYSFNTDEEPGTAIENISFSNLFMETRCPVFLASYCRELNALKAPPIRHIRFAGLNAVAEHHIVIQANEGAVVEDICFSDVHLQFSGTPEVHEQYGYGEWQRYTDRNAFFIANVNDVLLRDVMIRTDDESFPLDNTAIVYNSRQVRMENVRGLKAGREIHGEIHAESKNTAETDFKTQ